MKLSDVVNLYLKAWGIHKADSTRYRVKIQLTAFITFIKLNSIDNVYCINISVLTLWVNHLKDKGCTPLTVYYTVQVVKMFFVWLKKEEYIDANPFPENFYSKKPCVPLRRVPSITQTFESLNSAELSHMYPNRNRAVLELAYSCGLRKMEIHSLSVYDVLSDEIRVIGKGKKERIVPLGKNAKMWIDRYIIIERKEIIEKSGSIENALFLSQQGRRVSVGTLHDITKIQSKQEYPLHSFRHACATHMLRNGASSRILQKLLGHEKLSTTQIYTSVDVTDLHTMLHNYHPRNKSHDK